MIRLELLAISEWVKQDSRVLDLGCGDGALLEHLQQTKSVDGLGLEIDADKITRGIERGICVIEHDLDKGLSRFADGSFDTVVMSQTLQAVHNPHLVLNEMLRVGRECIITFPNFGYWRARWHLTVRGRMPVSRFMPYAWYDTPNIHFCTVKDCEVLCRNEGIAILHRTVQDNEHKHSRLGRLWPNLFGTNAIYHVSRRPK
ncbi:methionine biosynthesis protein MetW [bacterium]|nr:methionine biosynthesis protein MetW [bacterium]